MNPKEMFTYREIMSQPEAWAAALDVLNAQKQAVLDLVKNGHFDTVVFTGCGSTYYLSLAAAPLFQQLTGMPTRGLPASEIWLYPGTLLKSQRILLVAVSRSGETTETLRACEAFKAGGYGKIVTLSCYPEMPLASMGDVNLVLTSGQEDSVAQTRAFSTLYVGATWLAAACAGRADLLDGMGKLPTACRSLLDRYESKAEELGKDASIDRIYYLGSGARYGLATELNLKMKEMSLSHAESFHFMEFRHGPMSMVNRDTLLVGLVSDGNRERELAVIDEMRPRGAKILTIAEKGAEVELFSNIPEEIRNPLYLPVGQLVAFNRAISRGQTPDHPHNLVTVVKLGS